MKDYQQAYMSLCNELETVLDLVETIKDPNQRVMFLAIIDKITQVMETIEEAYRTRIQ